MANADRDLVGIGGWLAFFVFILALLSPLALVGSLYLNMFADTETAAVIGPSWGALQAAESVATACFVALAWFMAYRLVYVRNRKTVRIVIAGLWLLGIGGVLVDGLLVIVVGGLAFDAVAGAVAAELVRPLISATLWTAYFLISKRVFNTYPEYGDSDELADIFR
jgi:hypothetical protein